MALSWDTFDTTAEAPTYNTPESFYPLIDEVAGAQGVDSNLLRSMVAAESSYNPKAISPKGAQGLLQLMPGTAKEMGVVDPLDPLQNLTGGAKYLKKHLDAYGGDVNKALAAYNWGPGNLASGAEMPKETVDYIAKVTAGLQPAKQEMSWDDVGGDVPKNLSWDSFVSDEPSPLQKVGAVVSQAGDVTGNTLGDFVQNDPIAPSMVEAFKESVTPVQPTGELPLGLGAKPTGVVGDVLDVAYGIPEAAGALASGVASFAGGQIAGLKDLPHDVESGAKAFETAEAVNKLGMYQPKTATGQLLLKPIEVAFGTLLGTVDRVVKATANPTDSPEDLDKKSKAAQYLTNTILLGSPFLMKGIDRVRLTPQEAKTKTTAEAVDQAKQKIVDDPKVPADVKEAVKATPADVVSQVVSQVNKSQAAERVAKGPELTVKVDRNKEIVEQLRIEAELREGRGKAAYTTAAKIVAEHPEDVEGIDLSGIKGIGKKTGGKIQEIIEARRVREAEASKGTGEDIPMFTKEPEPVVAPVQEPPAQTVNYSGPTLIGKTGEVPKVESIAEAPKVEAAPPVESTKVLEVPPAETPTISEFDSVKIAKEEGYEFPTKRTFATESEALADATKRGEGFEVLKVGSKYRVGKYANETYPEYPTVEAVMADGYEVGSRVSKERAAADNKTDGFGIAKVGDEYYRTFKKTEEKVQMELEKTRPDALAEEVGREAEDLWDDGVSADDWKALEQITGKNEAALRAELAEASMRGAIEEAKVKEPSVNIDPKEEILYHGSRSENIEGDFRPTEYGDYGKGVYLTPRRAFANSFTNLQNFGVSGADVKRGPRGSLFEVTHKLKPEEFFGGDKLLTPEELKWWEEDGSMMEEITTHAELADAESASNMPGGSSSISSAWDKFLDKFGYKGVRAGAQVMIRDPKNVNTPTKVLSNAEAAQKFIELRNALHNKMLHSEPPRPKGKVRKKVPKPPVEAMPALNDQFATFKTLEEAKAFKEATGREGAIIQDPLTKQYMLEPELDLPMDKIDVMDSAEREFGGDVYSEEGRVGESDYYEMADGEYRARNMWDILNNERGSVDVTGLASTIESIERVQKLATKLGVTVGEYMDMLGVDQATRELFVNSLANIGQMRQEVRDKDPLMAKILMPEDKIVAQQVKRNKKGEVVWTLPPVPKALADAVLGMDRKGNWGTDVVHTDPVTGKVRIEHTTTAFDRFMEATETKIYAFKGPLKEMYRTWRDAKAAAKLEKNQVREWLGELKSKIAPDRLKDFAIAAYADMKSVKEAYEKMGITEIPKLTAEEMKVKEELLAYTRKFRERANFIRTHTGQKGIPKLLDLNGQENYLPLFRDMNVLRDLGITEGMVSSTSSKLGELSKSFNGLFNPHAKKRNVSDIAIELDPFKAIERYSSYGLDEIHISPVAALAKELSHVKLPNPNGKGKVSLWEVNPYVSKLLSKWSDAIVGKDPVATAMANMNPFLSRAIKKGSNNLVVATIGGSLRTVFVQPTSFIVNAFTILDARSAAYGIMRLMGERPFKAGATRARQKSSVLSIREAELIYSELAEYMKEGVINGWRAFAADKSLAPMKWVDGIVAEASWNAAYHYGEKRLKLSGEELVHYADDVVEKTQGLGIKGAVSDLQTHQAFKWLTLLQTFGIADYNFIIRDVIGMKNADVSNGKAMVRAAKYLVATMLAGQMYKAMGYENVVPDPIGEYIKARDSRKSTPHALLSAAGEFLEKVPIIGGSAKYGSSLGGVAGEWANMVPDAAQRFAELTDWDKISDRKRRSNMIVIAKALGTTMGIPFTSQILKSIRAADQGGNPYQVILGVYIEEQRRRGGAPSLGLP